MHIDIIIETPVFFYGFLLVVAALALSYIGWRGFTRAVAKAAK